METLNLLCYVTWKELVDGIKKYAVWRRILEYCKTSFCKTKIETKVLLMLLVKLVLNLKLFTIR